MNSAAEKKQRNFFPLIKSSNTSREKSAQKEQNSEYSKFESNAKSPMGNSSSMLARFTHYTWLLLIILSTKKKLNHLLNVKYYNN